MALSPGEPTAYRELGLSKLYLGETREAADCFRHADNIAPCDVERWSWLRGRARSRGRARARRRALAADRVSCG
jgi:hypothetical protein